jgi:hypothetical protein
MIISFEELLQKYTFLKRDWVLDQIKIDFPHMRLHKRCILFDTDKVEEYFRSKEESQDAVEVYVAKDYFNNRKKK